VATALPVIGIAAGGRRGKLRPRCGTNRATRTRFPGRKLFANAEGCGFESDAGNDRIEGRDGNDSALLGGLGNDSISGDAGNDGGSAAGSTFGGPATLEGNEGNDSINGGTGSDRITDVHHGVAADSDALFGGPDDDGLIKAFDPDPGRDFVDGGTFNADFCVFEPDDFAINCP
jgi:hemolysin type calcium-binding protein